MIQIPIESSESRQKKNIWILVGTGIFILGIAAFWGISNSKYLQIAIVQPENYTVALKTEQEVYTVQPGGKLQVKIFATGATAEKPLQALKLILRDIPPYLSRPVFTTTIDNAQFIQNPSNGQFILLGFGFDVVTPQENEIGILSFDVGTNISPATIFMQSNPESPEEISEITGRDSTGSALSYILPAGEFFRVQGVSVANKTNAASAQQTNQNTAPPSTNPTALTPSAPSSGHPSVTTAPTQNPPTGNSNPSPANTSGDTTPQNTPPSSINTLNSASSGSSGSSSNPAPNSPGSTNSSNSSANSQARPNNTATSSNSSESVDPVSDSDNSSNSAEGVIERTPSRPENNPGSNSAPSDSVSDSNFNSSASNSAPSSENVNATSFEDTPFQDVANESSEDFSAPYSTSPVTPASQLPDASSGPEEESLHGSAPLQDQNEPFDTSYPSSSAEPESINDLLARMNGGAPALQPSEKIIHSELSGSILSSSSESKTEGQVETNIATNVRAENFYSAAPKNPKSGPGLLIPLGAMMLVGLLYRKK